MGRPHRRRLRRLLLVGATAVVVPAGAAGAFGAVTAWRADRAVHYVALSPALVRAGADDLLVDVWRRGRPASLYVLRSTTETTTVLPVPWRLEVGTVGGRVVTAGDVPPQRPAPLVRGLESAGIPVSRFLGVDLRTVAPGSTLGRLVAGTESVGQVLHDPVAAAGALTDAAHHVYLGPGTSVSAVLGLLGGRACPAGHLPTDVRAAGTVTVRQPGAAGVVRRFLGVGTTSVRCPGGGQRLLALRG